MAKLYLKRYGHDILSNGYEVVPITPGTKFPNFNTWLSLPRITHKRVDRWLSNGHARDGVGVRAANTPMVDIDCRWKPLVAIIVAEAEDKIGIAPRRIGAAPKVGLIYRTDTPFKKVQSKAFTDPNGEKAQLEILSEGRQWVAYHVHPDTKKPYTWPDANYNLLDTPASELQEINEDQAYELVAFFEQWCIDQGWARWKTKKQSTALTTKTARDPDELMGSVALGLAIEEVRDWVERLVNDDDVEYEDNYDLDPETPNYRNVIFGIWHETEGSEEGREIAWDWSIKGPKHENEPGRFDKLWGSADHEDRDDAVTFRYVIKCVVIQDQLERKEARDNIVLSLQACTDQDDLSDIVKQIKAIHFEGFDFETLAQELKKAWNRITGFTLSIEKARKAIAHTPKDNDLPPWVKPWVYIQHTARFYNRHTGVELEYKAFDASFSRFLGGSSAIDFALNTAQIKPFWMQMYKPDDDETFWFEGHECVNTFSDRLMPPMPAKYRKSDLRAIAIVEAHLERMLPDQRERELFISYLAYVVQTRSRPNWMTVLQGVEGDGKTFFGVMMGAILGSNNVRILDAPQLEDRYTAWAVGQLMCFIEELRMHGHSRYDVLDKIKPYITNEAINVHPKNVNPYTALNTTAYVAWTNHRNALPIGDNDRRYMILYSAWQTGEDLRKSLQDDPDYFARLFSTIKGPKARPGALRQWLMEYELHAEFDPLGRAPLTEARADMIALSKSDAQIVFEELLEEDNHPQISRELVVAGAFTAYMYDHAEETMNTSKVGTFLTGNGYSRLPFRHRVQSKGDKVESIWVRVKSAFKAKNLSDQRERVMKLLRLRKADINHRDDI